MFERFLKRGKLIILLYFAITLAGGYLFFQLPKRELPEFTPNIMAISTVYPGADAQRVETEVTNILEKRFSDMQGIEEYSSTSSTEFSNIIIEVEDQVNFDDFTTVLQQEINQVKDSLPEETLEPTINNQFGNVPVASYLFTANSFSDLKGSQDKIKDLASSVEEIDGVANVVIKGFENEQAAFDLNQESLAKYGLNVGTIINSIQKEYNTTPLGEKGSTRLTLDHYTDISDIENIRLYSPTTQNTIQLSNVGTFRLEEETLKDIVSYEGKPAYSITINIKPGLDIPTIYNEVNNLIKTEVNLPSNIEMISYYSQKADVDSIFSSLIKEASVAVLAVIIITTLGLTIGGAFIVSLAIPISITLGLLPLPFLNIDLNQISVIGLIVALGILVDDAIVVNDNILRQYKMTGQKNLLQATKTGVQEVWGSIVTSTLAVVFAFLPLTFLSGSNGSFIRSLPTVLILTIVASMIISLTLVPVYQYQINKRKKKISKKEPGLLGKPLKKLADFYADVLLKKVTKKPIMFGISGLILSTAIFGLSAFVPFEFFPAANKQEVVISVTTPTDTTLEETFALLTDLENDLKNKQGIEETSIFAGSGVPNLFSSSITNPGDNTGQLVIRVDNESLTATQFIEENTSPIREKYQQAEIFLDTIVQGPPVGAPVTVDIEGDDFGKLIEVRDQLKEDIGEIDNGLIIDNVKEPTDTYLYTYDRDKLAESSSSAKAISDQIRLATEGIPLGSFQTKTNQIDLVLKQDTNIHKKEVDLNALTIPVQKANGDFNSISLDQFVTKETIQSYETIPHKNGEKTITIKAYPGDSESFEEDVEKLINNTRGNMDENVQLTIGGENESQTQFFVEITLLFAIVMILIFITIAFQFNSLSIPFLVLGSVYLAIAGAVAGLFVTQTPFSFMATMGIVSLAGIVVRNAVVLFEFIEQRLKAGLGINEAVIEAGRARIRPILLTAFTALAALMPVALSNDPLFKPLAISIVSGVFFSTILTLIIVPAFYIVVAKMRKVENLTD
ncbi:efflux RND transporter permease subunit [Bacillus carboniphilus]|uniref:Efflux RND transporter permease subunit n=1 Tax=Bacillus carboniphilus TaxID=86663 RepID=A0ABY9JUN3_9BACI|nr:efflux RND transporter permease subunit [Bacillus carboniphilus]WLR43106.1 efflux RND transporter permease subunit [Bacillus carboniphilus]